MHHINFYYDPISPYAYLAFMQLPKALEGLSYSVSYTPILFAGLLKNHGQLGPAEIAPKREWTYRQVLWQAKELGIDFQMPANHPFNPLGLLRLATACSNVEGQTRHFHTNRFHTNRFITQQIFNHVWLGGADAADSPRLDALATVLQGNIKTDPETAKARLKANTDAALQAGCFGVPTLRALRARATAGSEKNFWGLDALPMLREYLEGSDWFDEGGGWNLAAKVGAGIKRL
jgi:2-hydroxychromene-2-carboxylate isomerase